MLWLKVHSHLLLRACLLGSKRKLPLQACQVRPGPPVVCHPRGMQFPGTVYICSQGLFFKRLSPLHFLCTQCLQPLQKMLLLPTPVQQPELCGAYTYKKGVTTLWPSMSFTKMILSETLWTSKTFSIHSSATNTYTSSAIVISWPVELVPGVLALDCATVAATVSSLLNAADPLSCGIVFPLPRKLFFSGCSHWVFPPWIFSGACLIRHNGPTLPPTPDRRQAGDVTNRMLLSVGTA